MMNRVRRPSSGGNKSAAGFFSAAALLAVSAFLCLSCASWGTSAEEYFSIGMAYFELGKFEEAEKWLNRARLADRTKLASEYNLGRIAFERGRYEEAVNYFESILKKDPDNVLALKAAAYSKIKTGEIAAAEKYYEKILALTPESADDGYNYALVLYAMEKYADAERVLAGYNFALMDNSDVQLLYARTQNAQGKIEAADSYAKWLANNSDPKVRYEYARILEGQELYARSLEEYRGVLSALPPESTDPKKADIRFTIARLLLVADGESEEGVAELRGAVTDGYQDTAAIGELLDSGKISGANKESIKTIIAEIEQAAEQAKETAKSGEEDAVTTVETEASEAQVEAGADGGNK
ncbi:MAG: tetratricopeptide repeat protein [Treponema sp.]|jgi:tetratricopeptide (TPR) repeat protein|nr:tetratricopeptide repeat protein [Treponema sp.]